LTENSGRLPLTLTAVRAGGVELTYPVAMAVANFSDGELAGSAAVRMEEAGHKLETGPVKGWRMEPKQRQPGSHALVLDWGGMPSPPGKVVVYYRYLGLPLRYTVPWLP